jgi:LPXTG-motif cell wall-anchored protein
MMMNKSTARVVATLVAMACATAAQAEQADGPAFAAPAVDGPSCADLSWQKQIVARYPHIATACQEVVVSNSVRYARFTGELMRVNRDGSVSFDFKDRDGKSLGKATTLQPADSQRAIIEGRSYRLSELNPGQQLSVYVPETRLVVATDPAAPPEAVAKIVFEDPQPTVEQQPIEPARLAQATPVAAPAVQPARLPDTAGWTPMLVVAGLLALVGAILLMTRRRMRRLPWETDETEAQTARGREKRLSEELRALWDKTTTTETLRPRDEPKPGHAVPK